MALPGDAACRELGPCSDAQWGNIPTDAATIHVDGQFTGTSDGSATAPWATIAQAIAAAPAGALIAVAAGSYPEEVVIAGKAVRVWGRCAAMVEITGSGSPTTASIAVRAGAEGTEIRGVALTGARGLVVEGVGAVAGEQLWIHDTSEDGVRALEAVTPAHLTLRESLIESAANLGIVAAGAALTIERTVVRDTLPGPGGLFGRGLSAIPHPATQTPCTVAVSSSRFERNREAGIDIAGSNVTIDATLIRDTQPGAGNASGMGLVIRQDYDTGQIATAHVTRSVIEQSRLFGVYLTGAEATIETTTVRHTQPDPASGDAGDGIAIEFDPSLGAPSRALVRSCLSEANHSAGMRVVGGEATIEAVLARETLQRPADQRFGFGLAVFDHAVALARSNVTVRGTLIEANHGVGLHVSGSDAIIEDTWVRDTDPHLANQTGGRGINVQTSPETGARATATVVASLVERSHDAGIIVIDSDATIEATTIRETRSRPLDGRYGDGLTAWAALDVTSLVANGVTIERSGRAGVASFGATVALQGSALDCNLLDLASQDYGGRQSSFQNLGDNRCGCGDAAAECVAISADLQPPEPLEP